MSTGRPRDARRDAAILAAALEILAESGYPRLTIDAVARRAGVGRPTVYLRWPSKAQLVHEAVFPDIATEDLPIPRTASFAHDVRLMARQAVEYLARPEVLTAAPGLMAEFAADPELRRLMAERLEDRLRVHLKARVAAAIASGEARPDLDPDLLLDVITGSVLFALLVRPPGDQRIDPAALANLVLHGVVPRGPTRPRA
jgi:AcrR family transcriptional regulator